MDIFEVIKRIGGNTSDLPQDATASTWLENKITEAADRLARLQGEEAAIAAEAAAVKSNYQAAVADWEAKKSERSASPAACEIRVKKADLTHKMSLLKAQREVLQLSQYAKGTPERRDAGTQVGVINKQTSEIKDQLSALEEDLRVVLAAGRPVEPLLSVQPDRSRTMEIYAARNTVTELQTVRGLLDNDHSAEMLEAVTVLDAVVKTMAEAARVAQAQFAVLRGRLGESDAHEIFRVLNPGGSEADLLRAVVVDLFEISDCC